MLRILAGAVLLLTSIVPAAAQYGDRVEPRFNRRGDPVCPSNYVIRGDYCVSIYADRRGYDRRERWDDDRGYRGRRDRDWDERGYRGGGIEPQLNRRGELQCPSNYVIRRGLCVSLY